MKKLVASFVMGAPCKNTRCCLPFPEEPLEGLDCAIPLPEVNRIWSAQSPPDSGVPKATLPSHSAASRLHLYGMLLCSPLSFWIVFTKDLSFTDQSYSSKAGFYCLTHRFCGQLFTGKIFILFFPISFLHLPNRLTLSNSF